MIVASAWNANHSIALALSGCTGWGLLLDVYQDAIQTHSCRCQCFFPLENQSINYAYHNLLGLRDISLLLLTYTPENHQHGTHKLVVCRFFSFSNCAFQVPAGSFQGCSLKSWTSHICQLSNAHSLSLKETGQHLNPCGW